MIGAAKPCLGGNVKKCFECETIEDLQEHHVVPRSKGGTKTVTLCYQCHRKAHGSDGKGIHFSQLMKDMWSAKRARGEQIGNPNIKEYGEKARQANIVRGRQSCMALGAEIERVKGELISVSESGKVTLTTIAEELNKQDITTPRGRKWTNKTVCKMLKRYNKYKEKE